MRSILLHMHPDGGHDMRLAAAVELARTLDGQLTCVQPVPYPAYLAADPMAYAGTPALFEAIEHNANDFRRATEERLAREGIAWEWLQSAGDAAATIVSQSRFADLILLSRDGPGGSGEPSIVGDVALHVRTPVMAVPATGAPLDLGGVVMLAWNGSHEAANALRAAVPLLRRAEAVHVVSIGDQAELFGVGEACRYLARHELPYAPQERQRGDGPVGERLSTIAAELGASYIVLGAYGHSRLRELLLGGVTRWMLEHSALPLLLAH
jgi:nucleotide-binding universal stress UspA family protein